MLRIRVMPCLLLKGWALVKTRQFKNPIYVGDPINTVRIFNEKEVDELIFLDISATPGKKSPPFQLIEEIASECFMPFTYGGGLRAIEDIKTILGLGVEKVAINSYAVENPQFIRNAADKFGSQSIVVSIDSRKNIFGKYKAYTHGGRRDTKIGPAQLAARMEELGAGEIMITAIDRDGTFDGYDIELTRMVSETVSIPVIASGGAGEVEDFGKAVQLGGASAVAAGSMVVYQGRNRSVLTNFPTRDQLEEVFQ